MVLRVLIAVGACAGLPACSPPSSGQPAPDAGDAAGGGAGGSGGNGGATDGGAAVDAPPGISGGKDAAPDMPAAPTRCDEVTNAPCSGSAPRCTLVCSGDEPVVACAEVGTTAVGAPCSLDSDCVVGSACAGPPGQETCLKLCRADADCASLPGLKCIARIQCPGAAADTASVQLCYKPAPSGP